jgi:hypothetical protein
MCSETMGLYLYRQGASRHLEYEPKSKFSKSDRSPSPLIEEPIKYRYVGFSSFYFLIPSLASSIPHLLRAPFSQKV